MAGTFNSPEQLPNQALLPTRNNIACSGKKNLSNCVEFDNLTVETLLLIAGYFPFALFFFFFSNLNTFHREEKYSFVLNMQIVSRPITIPASLINFI